MSKLRKRSKNIYFLTQFHDIFFEKSEIEKIMVL